jgi:hypothetical protein
MAFVLHILDGTGLLEWLSFLSLMVPFQIKHACNLKRLVRNCPDTDPKALYATEPEKDPSGGEMSMFYGVSVTSVSMCILIVAHFPCRAAERHPTPLLLRYLFHSVIVLLTNHTHCRLFGASASLRKPVGHLNHSIKIPAELVNCN